MYPWIDPSDPHYKEYNGSDGNGRLNYLLYLEMTGNEDGTVSKASKDGRFLKEMGNWTDGRNPGKDPRSKFGTFMLTEKKFLEEYLLPKFDKINRMVKIDLSDLKAEVYTEGFCSYFPGTSTWPSEREYTPVPTQKTLSTVSRKSPLPRACPSLHHFLPMR